MTRRHPVLSTTLVFTACFVALHRWLKRLARRWWLWMEKRDVL